MSKTFTSNPSHSVRGRGSDRGGVRGAGTRPSVGVGRSSGSTSVAPGGSRSTFQGDRGRGLGLHGNRVGARSTPGLNSSSSNSARPAATTRSRGGPTLVGRGRMDNHNARNPGTGLGGTSGASHREGEQAGQPDLEGRGQHVGGYTVFSPNEKRRQKIEEMARRETQAYEQYKQANAGKTFSYVGTVGGGETSQHQVRARQANEVRAQKFNRQMRQEQHRQVAKQAEEQTIQAHKEQARRKAEQNAARNSRAAAPEEVRRKREAFLAQLENKTQANEATGTSGRDTTGAASASRREFQPVTSPTSSTRQPVRSSNINNNNNNGRTATTSREVAEAPAHQSHSRSSGGRDPAAEVKVEPEFKQEPSEAGRGSNPHSRWEEELSILVAMYPGVETDQLQQLLVDFGSLDKAIEVLDFQ